MWEILSLFLLLLAQCQSIGDTNVMGWVLIPVCNVNFELNFFFLFFALMTEQRTTFFIPQPGKDFTFCPILSFSCSSYW